jgi:hypothetical protein
MLGLVLMRTIFAWKAAPAAAYLFMRAFRAAVTHLLDIRCYQ